MLVGAALLQGCARHGWSGDPDLVASAFAHPGAALMWPGAIRAFEVRADGSLYNGIWRVAIAPSADGVEAGAPRRIAFEDRWRPVAHWRREGGGVRWEFEAAALPAPAPADTSLLVTLEVRVSNPGARAIPASLAFTIGPPPARAGWAALDGLASDPLPALEGNGEVRLAGYAPGAREGRPAWSFTLPPGGSRTFRVVLAAHALPRSVLAGWSAVPHASRIAQARRYWDTATAAGWRPELGDPEVERALRAARVVLLCCRERHGGHWLPTGGPFQYHDIWLRDGARSIAALAMTGDTRVSRELADGFTGYQWVMGAFLSQRSQLDGNGQALWAFAQSELRPAPDSSVARFAELALDACGWNEAQRAFGAASGLPLGGMLPYAEPRDGELTRAQLVGNDAWALCGFESAARLLRAAGRERDAAHVDSLRARVAVDFEAALARTHSPDVPPSWQGAGRDWGNLATGWPCRALRADDPRLAALADRVARASSAPGLASYGAADSLHGYLGADLGTWALLAGRPERAQLALDALLKWRDATGAGAELFSGASRDYGANLPPHPTSAAALVALVRDMIVYDDGDTLQLTLGPRASWWRGARLRGAPTRWGVIDVGFRASATSAEWTWSAAPVWTALTLPAGRVLAAAPPAPLVGSVGARVLLAPPGARHAKVDVSPGARP
jgi:hypothetical protein